MENPYGENNKNSNGTRWQKTLVDTPSKRSSSQGGAAASSPSAACTRAVRRKGRAVIAPHCMLYSVENVYGEKKERVYRMVSYVTWWTHHSHVVTCQTMTYDTILRVRRGKVVGATGAAGGPRIRACVKPSPCEMAASVRLRASSYSPVRQQAFSARTRTDHSETERGLRV